MQARCNVSWICWINSTDLSGEEPTDRPNLSITSRRASKIFFTASLAKTFWLPIGAESGIGFRAAMCQIFKLNLCQSQSGVKLEPLFKQRNPSASFFGRLLMWKRHPVGIKQLLLQHPQLLRSLRFFCVFWGFDGQRAAVASWFCHS